VSFSIKERPNSVLSSLRSGTRPWHPAIPDSVPFILGQRLAEHPCLLGLVITCACPPPFSFASKSIPSRALPSSPLFLTRSPAQGKNDTPREHSRIISHEAPRPLNRKRNGSAFEGEFCLSVAGFNLREETSIIRSLSFPVWCCKRNLKENFLAQLQKSPSPLKQRISARRDADSDFQAAWLQWRRISLRLAGTLCQIRHPSPQTWPRSVLVFHAFLTDGKRRQSPTNSPFLDSSGRRWP